MMSDKHEIVHVFPTHVEAEKAVLVLQKAGFDMQKISIIAKDYQTTDHVRGFLSWKDTTKAGAGEGAYWGSFMGGLFGILTGAGLLFIPGMGQVIVAGPIVGVLAGWLEGMIIGGAGAAVVGGLAGASPEVRDRSQSWEVYGDCFRYGSGIPSSTANSGKCQS